MTFVRKVSLLLLILTSLKPNIHEMKGGQPHSLAWNEKFKIQVVITVWIRDKGRAGGDGERVGDRKM